METALPTRPSKKRLEWLDALRGFTMILVVAYHVAQIGFSQTMKSSSSLPFLVLFRMPLFFFVSGFLAYKASQVWTAHDLGQLLLKKLRVQIVPTVVFFLFATAVLRNGDYWEQVVLSLSRVTKGGYWFTLVLLYRFVLYYLFAYVESKLRCRSWVPITLFFLLSLVAYESCYLPKYFSWAEGFHGEKSALMEWTSFVRTMEYMPFFLYGNIVHRYWERSQRLMDSKWFYPIIVTVVIFATLDVLKWHTMRMEWANVPSTLAKFILLTMVFMYFRHYQDYFSRLTVIGSSLQYIGRRTLDIYLIHFLFLPNLPGIGSFFSSNSHNFAIDVTLSVLIALIVVAFSIITSNILRVSPFFKKWLFGRE